MSLEEDLLAIETELWTGGPEAYRKHTDDGMPRGVRRDGRDDVARGDRQDRGKGPLEGREDAGEGPEQALRTRSVVISYECTATRKDGQPHHAFVSSGYAHRAGGWKLAFHQQTKL